MSHKNKNKSKNETITLNLEKYEKLVKSKNEFKSEYDNLCEEYEALKLQNHNLLAENLMNKMNRMNSISSLMNDFIANENETFKKDIKANENENLKKDIISLKSYYKNMIILIILLFTVIFGTLGSVLRPELKWYFFTPFILYFAYSVYEKKIRSIK